nr:uncharacterized protein I203_03123 [Kwoniella mangroviensis CBS 8507]OCF67429.1 hypothetical protein I203_03123 [Kwoniella mangroviensis CBS 8507]
MKSSEPKPPITFTLHPHSTSTTDRVILETIKKDSNSIVLRLYESLGVRTKTTLKITGLPKPSALKWLNILEEPEMFKYQPVKWKVDDGAIEVDIDFRCFEIKTLGIYLD